MTDYNCIILCLTATVWTILPIKTQLVRRGELEMKEKRTHYLHDIGSGEVPQWLCPRYWHFLLVTHIQLHALGGRRLRTPWSYGWYLKGYIPIAANRTQIQEKMIYIYSINAVWNGDMPLASIDATTSEMYVVLSENERFYNGKGVRLQTHSLKDPRDRKLLE